MIVFTDPVVAAHAGLAIRDRVRSLRRDHLPVPPELVQLADELLRAAASRHDRPDLGGSAVDVETQLMTPGAAAAFLGISTRSLHRLASSGQVPSLPWGKGRRYSIAALREFAAGKGSKYA